MVDGVRIEGLQELAQALRELPRAIGRNVLRGSINAGAEEIRQEAIRRAPLYHGEVQDGHPPPGTLKRSIIKKQIRELSDDQKQTFYVLVRHGKKYQKQGKKGDKSQDAFYWWFVENGHYAGGSKPEKMSNAAMRLARKSGSVTGSVFILAHPFLRPAYETKKASSVDAIKNYIANRLPDEVAKLPKFMGVRL